MTDQEKDDFMVLMGELSILVKFHPTFRTDIASFVWDLTDKYHDDVCDATNCDRGNKEQWLELVEMTTEINLHRGGRG